MSTTLQSSIWKGWCLTLTTIAALLLMAVIAVYVSPSDVEGVSLVIRLTARTSLILFLLVFIASSLAKLVPTPFSLWLRANRRYLGVAFAGSHVIHAAALVTFAQLNPTLFSQLTSIGTYIAGGIAYIFIILMTITSFDGPARIVGRKLWEVIHTSGIWFIWISFIISFGKRIPKSEYYIIPVCILVLAMTIRLIAMRSTVVVKTK